MQEGCKFTEKPFRRKRGGRGEGGGGVGRERRGKGESGEDTEILEKTEFRGHKSVLIPRANILRTTFALRYDLKKLPWL